MHHGGERGDGNHVAGGLDGALFGVFLDQLEPIRVRRRSNVAQFFENRERVVSEQCGELGVAVPRAQHRGLVDAEGLAADWRHERARLLQLDVALAGLLRVVERVRVEERPHEMARDVLESELEVRVLIDGVVAGVEGERADGVALLLGDLVGADDAGRIAGTRGGNRTVERGGGRGSQCDDWRPVASTVSADYRELWRRKPALVVKADDRSRTGDRRPETGARSVLLFLRVEARELFQVGERLHRRHAVEEEHAVEMIGLVLRHAGGEILQLQLERAAIPIERLSVMSV